MAGQVSKANGRQMQKSKQGKNYGIKVTRMSKIPLVCKTCGKKREVPSQQAYIKGGINCSCIKLITNEVGKNVEVRGKMSFDVEAKDFGAYRSAKRK